MNALMTLIVLWLSANFGLPAILEHPRIEFVTAEELIARYHDVDSFTRQADTTGIREHATTAHEVREIVAVYSDDTRTIFLEQSWTGETPADLSVLVHELVHHIQNIAGLRSECAQAREKLAYAAQDNWLHLFGLDLSGEFGLDGFTLLARTSCLLH